MTLPRLALHVLAAALIAPALLPAAEAAGRDGGPPTTLSDAPGVPVLGPRETAVPSPPPVDGIELWLRGAFGRVAGGSVAAPGSAPPRHEPLDMYVRRAALLLELPRDPGVTVRRVVARPASAGSAPRQGVPAASTLPSWDTEGPRPVLAPQVLWIPGSGDAPGAGDAIEIEGPAEPGTGLIVAELTTPAGQEEVAWLVHVPDREPPADGLYDIPAPGIMVSSTRGERRGRDGSGCYAYLCVDVGYAPPVEELPALAVAVKEVLEVRLEDGSAFVGWKARLSPLDRSRHATLDGEAGPGVPDDVMPLSGLAVPSAGRWLLDLFVEFDRERGWMRTYLVVDAR